ncbi:MAG: DUF2207 domain-containing protein [Candidatus Kerfeldbacteria bacterium]|nr:DUF2207 domain-containing protein [Candidatus Kerfeldbacteria bacterium]
MKRFSLLLGLAFLLISRPAQAAGLSYESFKSDITIHTDASISVKEIIVVNFSSPHHGIFRNIPFRYTDQQSGQSTALPIDILSVTDEQGGVRTYTVSTLGDDMQVKIGDAGQEISGQQTYIISYHVAAAVNFFSDHDELYWNVTGTHWDEPLTNVTATLHLPTNIPKASLTTKCFTGDYGSTKQDCQATAQDGGATFTAHDFLTVVFGFPTGIVTKPANYDHLRTVKVAGSYNGILQGHSAWWWAINVILPALTFAFLLLWWETHGRDPKGRGTIIPQYEPPADIHPAEMDVILHEKFRPAVIPATIIDLAVRGYLKITEHEEHHAFGLAQAKKYTLTKLKEYATDDAQLRDYEKYLLDGLFTKYAEDSGGLKNYRVRAKILQSMSKQLQGSKFAWQPTNKVVRSTVELDELKTTFPLTAALVEQSLENSLDVRGYFSGNSLKQRGGFLAVGLIITYFAIRVGLDGSWNVGLILTGLMLLAYGPLASKRTTKGVDVLWAARGFKMFLEKAEKYRIQWQEKQNIFETYLPYAMVFGVAEKWSKALSSLSMTPPSWYESSSPAVFNSIVLWSSLSSFQSVSVQTTAAGGGSGFGGGGFSGGGGGGGGGGGW